MANLKLISFKICPFVQRAVIALKLKEIEYEIEYIDLSNPPEWFLKISPMGKVPVLMVGETVLFESAVIADYLDEEYDLELHPADPLTKAQQRALVEFGSAILMTQFQMCMTPEEAGYLEQRGNLLNQLKQLEGHLNQAPYFNGENLSMIDVSFAPLMMRLDIIQRNFLSDIFADVPKVQAWAENLLALTEVKQSVVENMEQLLLGRIKGAGGFIAS